MMELDKKLQVKKGESVALVHNPFNPSIKAVRESVELAGVVIVFVVNVKDVAENKKILLASAKRGAAVWVAYPKAKQLGTNLNRDILRNLAESIGLETVRQVAINPIWSALRLKVV